MGGDSTGRSHTCAFEPLGRSDQDMVVSVASGRDDGYRRGFGDRKMRGRGSYLCCTRSIPCRNFRQHLLEILHLVPIKKSSIFELWHSKGIGSPTDWVFSSRPIANEAKTIYLFWHSNY